MDSNGHELPEDLAEVGRRLRRERPTFSNHELDQIKLRAISRASRGKRAAGSSMRGTSMRVRLLSAAMALLTVGASAAVYGGNAAQAAYGGDKLVITTSAIAATASSSATAGPITVQLQTISGSAAVNVTGNSLTLNLSSTGTGEFSSSNTGSPTITTVTIPVGQSTATFYYGNQIAGSQTVTVSDPNSGNTETAATQNETINPGAATNVWYASLSVGSNGTLSSCAPFTCSWTGAGRNNPITGKVEITDAFGNVVSTVGSGHTVAVSGSNGTATGSPLAIPSSGPAISSGTFTYTTHNNNGWSTDTVTAASSGYTSGSISLTF
jgi:hypothetical protein